jgi:polysaccharide pyruvyl transferase WcaK-like protein
VTTVAHWGTFEVANLGDLLFPLVLEHHLRAVHGDVDVRWVGPLGGIAPMGLDRPVARALPFEHEGFWQQAAPIDAFVLGGGELVHSGEVVIERAGAPARLRFAPFATDLGLLAEVRPVAWNAVGVPVDIPEALAPLLRSATAKVDLLAVRDEASRKRLEAAGVEQPVEVVPDTAVLVDDVIGPKVREHAIARLRAARRLPPPGDPVVVVHLSFATPAVLDETAAALVAVAHSRPTVRFVLVALGETHGDGATLRSLAARVGASASVIAKPSVEEAATVLGAADVVVSSSYHAVLLASTFGVPAAQFRHAAHRPAKHDALAEVLGRERWLLDRPAEIPAAVEALLDGAGPPDAALTGRLRRGAEAHLARVAEVVARGHRPGVDLAERTAAHRHVVARLEARTRVETALRTDVAALREHHDRAVARATAVEDAYWRARQLLEADGAGAPVREAGP